MSTRRKELNWREYDPAKILATVPIFRGQLSWGTRGRYTVTEPLRDCGYIGVTIVRAFDDEHLAIQCLVRLGLPAGFLENT